MAGEQGGTGSGGAPGAAEEAKPGAPTVTPPAPPAPKAGIPLELLPPELKELVEGRSEAEQRLILNNLVGSVKKQNQRIKELEQAKATAAPPPPKDDKPKKSLEERILESPEDTILEVVNKHFGGRFSQVEKNAGQAIYAAIKSEDPEFAQYEDEVKKIVEDNGIEPSRENLLGAYTMAIGARQLEQRRRATSAALNPERPAGDAPPANPKKTFTDLQVEIASAHRMTPEEYFSKSSLEVKVPENPKPKKVAS